MLLKRKADGLVLCDRIWGWSHWDEPSAAERDTISGMPFSFVGQRARPRTTSISCTFSPGTEDGTGATLANLGEIKRLHHRGQLLVFRDREGNEADVRVRGWAESEVWDEVKTKTVVNVVFSLLDPTVRY